VGNVEGPEGGGGGGVEARDFTVSEGHGHPLVCQNMQKITKQIFSNQIDNN
jgi:hypothetical protein